MMVILFDFQRCRAGQASQGFAIGPGTELLNRPYMDRLAEAYRDLGAREVLAAGCGEDLGTSPSFPTERPWRPLDEDWLRAGSMARRETVLIADARLWPNKELKRLATRHRRSALDLTLVVHAQRPEGYLENIESAGAASCSAVRRRYHETSGKPTGRRYVAALAEARLLGSVWSSVRDDLQWGDLERLMEHASCAQVHVTTGTPLIETIGDYLALSKRLLAREGALPAGARRIGRRVWAMPGATVAEGCRLRGPVLLGRDCRVGAGAQIVGPTVVGGSAEVGEGCFVGESVLLGGAALPPEACVWQSVLESGADIKPEQKLSFVWAGKEAVHRWSPEEAANGVSSVVVSSKRPLRRCSLRLYAAAKRTVDICGAVAGLILTLPLYPFIALAIKWESPGPVFFVHRRQTRGGKEFGCLKFRTMFPNADEMLRELAEKNQVDGPQFHIDDDPRLTRVGKFLRRTNLDETPQFWNVLLGHMSLVGPRPSPDGENQFCPAWRETRLSVRPGLTGLWQMNRTDRAGGDFHQWILYDTQYVRELALRADLKLIWATVRHFLRLPRSRTPPKGVAEAPSVDLRG